MSWEMVRFSELFLEPTRNGVYKSADAHGYGHRIVNMGELFAYDFISDQEMKRIAMTEDELTKDGLKENDLLFARRSLVESGAGKVSIVGETHEPITFESSIIRVRLDATKCEPLFYYYWLKSPAGRGAIGALVTGTNVKGIRASALKDIMVMYPDIENQKRMAYALKKYDDLIENNQKQIKLLEEAAQRLYKEWFVDLRFPGHETTRIIDGIPDGWKKCPIGEMIRVVRGRSYSSKELSDVDGVLMVNLSNIRAYGGYNRNQEKHYTGKYNDEQVVETHDLLMGVTDMTQERRTVGRVALVPNLHAKAMISMDLIKLIPSECSTLFLYALLNYGGYSEVVSRFANGTNVLHLRPDVLDIVDAVIPDDKMQRLFVGFFEKIQNRIDILQDEITIAGEARDRLLPKLMSGEIEL